MSSNKQTKFACCAQVATAAAVFSAFFAMHSADAQQRSAQGAAQLTAHIAVPATEPGGAAKPLTPSGSDRARAAASAACSAPTELAHFDQPLVHTMRQLANGQPLTIVAIGSSS